MHLFEFDKNKSLTNFEKHKIDFMEAQKIWTDPSMIQIKTKCESEERYLIIGIIGKKYWSAIVTYRNNNIRLISVRRSRKTEVLLYEN